MTTAELARSPAVWALGLGQTLAYAAIFYVFAALILPWQNDLGWSKAAFAAGPTLALLVCAGATPFVGRLVDRGLGPESLALGPLLGAVGLVWLATVPGHPAYLAGWAVIGLAQAACLYEPCFAFLMRRLAGDARAAIVRVTLLAGFASTLAFPAGALLAGATGWQGALLVAAAVMAFGVAPLHVYGAWTIRRIAPPPASGPAIRPRHAVGAALALPGFWILAAMLSLLSLNHWMMMSFLVPVFVGLGALPAKAVLAASVIGPAQVAGRLVLLRFESRLSNRTVAAATFGLIVLAPLVLAATGAAASVIFVYAVVQGAAMGVTTILRPVLIAETMGTGNYGTVAALIQMPSIVASALAPALGAVILDGAGIGALVATSFAIALGAFVAAMAAARGQGSGAG
jgi:predicted MFS family arabinose efflux permease